MVRTRLLAPLAIAVAATALASCSGSAPSSPITSPSSAPEACLSVASDDHGSVVAFFASTVGAIRTLSTAAQSQNLAAHASSEPATVCYIDGEIPKGPPPPQSGTVPRSFDRVVVVVVGQDVIPVAAGYHQNLPIQAP